MLCHLGHMDIHQPVVPRKAGRSPLYLLFSVRAMIYYKALETFSGLPFIA